MAECKSGLGDLFERLGGELEILIRDGYAPFLETNGHGDNCFNVLNLSILIVMSKLEKPQGRHFVKFCKLQFKNLKYI
ncbi:hypothetical protein BdWA1_000417 [Babesia duncani]|uniref:Uncharacterized protein n=1 Tax=Babesia duncani TaxID=323732 RepID=A0AAD9PN19_9APIC|nr:hypothetical protein BdWA1_000417 [Babesia duncani]